MSDGNFHVLVAGGGIGGLCLAQALRRANISVAVYERDDRRDARLDRYRLHINPAGSRSLHACLSPQAWAHFLGTAGRTGGGFGFLTEQLQTMVVVEDEIMYPPSTDPAEKWYPVDRKTLREVLLTDLAGVVHFGKAFERYESAPGGGVIAHFADGSRASGDLLVGCDGTGSRVRRQRVPEASPVDAGARGIGMKLPLTATTRAWLPTRLTRGENLIFAPDPFFLFTSVFDIGVPALPDTNGSRDGGGYLLCAFVVGQHVGPADLGSLEPAQLQQVVVDLTRRWHPDLRRVLAECDSDSPGCFPFVCTTPIPTWPASNVTLLGDAVHAMPPTGGLGANTALRDARLLAAHLGEVATGRIGLTEAIDAYQGAMRVYASTAVRSSLTTLRQGLATNGAALTGMRTWLRLSGAVAPLRWVGFQDNWARHSRPQPWELTAGT